MVVISSQAKRFLALAIYHGAIYHGYMLKIITCLNCDFVFEFQGFDYSLEGLKKWKTATLSQDTFPVSAFSVFLPQDEQLVGEIWYLIHPMISRYGKQNLCSNQNIWYYRCIPIYNQESFPKSTKFCKDLNIKLIIDIHKISIMQFYWTRAVCEMLVILFLIDRSVSLFYCQVFPCLLLC